MLSSGADAALGCRGPWDVVNLGVIWGLKQEAAREAVGEAARAAVAGALLRARSYRGGGGRGGWRAEGQGCGGAGAGKDAGAPGIGDAPVDGSRKAAESEGGRKRKPEERLDAKSSRPSLRARNGKWILIVWATRLWRVGMDTRTVTTWR